MGNSGCLPSLGSRGVTPGTVTGKAVCHTQAPRAEHTPGVCGQPEPLRRVAHGASGVWNRPVVVHGEDTRLTPADVELEATSRDVVYLGRLRGPESSPAR